MKKTLPLAGRLVLLGTLLVTISGCLKDKVTNTYKISVPVYETLSQARSVIKAGAFQTIQNAAKISVYKNYLFVTEGAAGVHVIDNTDPAQPRNISFIAIPGITDLSLKNDVLYANDTYGDLVVMDVTDPAHALVKKYIPQIFGTYYASGNSLNPDSIQVITAWVTKDTTVPVNPDAPFYYNNPGCANCEYLATAVPGAAANNTGTNGSTAGFAIQNNYLYALSFGSQLNVVDISSATDPALTNRLNLAAYSETIYPFENKLFLGTSTGMDIYDISDPAAPVEQGSFAHVRTCDPVITDGQHAFVTLRSGTTCQGYTNEVDILDISNLSNPTLLNTYALTNPRGLSKDGDLLFICDGTDGLKIYNAANISQLLLIKTLPAGETNDVITENGIAIVIATDGLYQFDYTDVRNIHQISKISADVSASR